MKSGLLIQLRFRFLGIGLLWVGLVQGFWASPIAFGQTPKASATATVTATPTVSASPSVAASATAASAQTPAPAPVAIPPAEKKKLLAEFKKAQSSEEQAFFHTKRSQDRELSAAQNQRKKQWFENEKRQRHEFFKSHMNGPERRKYVQDYIQNKKAFERSIKDETANSKKMWAERLDRLKVKQKQQAAMFKAKLDQGERPDASLWPN
jgi:hypothetical protein